MPFSMTYFPKPWFIIPVPKVFSLIVTMDEGSPWIRWKCFRSWFHGTPIFLSLKDFESHLVPFSHFPEKETEVHQSDDLFKSHSYWQTVRTKAYLWSPVPCFPLRSIAEWKIGYLIEGGQASPTQLVLLLCFLLQKCFPDPISKHLLLRVFATTQLLFSQTNQRMQRRSCLPTVYTLQVWA